MVARARVLVVEDDQDQRVTLGALLETMGHARTLVRTADEALKVLAERPFDLVISDVMMPGTDGMTFARRARVIYPDLAILLITGYDDQVEGILEHGMVALLKPVSSETFESVIAELLAQRGR